MGPYIRAAQTHRRRPSIPGPKPSRVRVLATKHPDPCGYDAELHAASDLEKDEHLHHLPDRGRRGRLRELLAVATWPPMMAVGLIQAAVRSRLKLARAVATDHAEQWTPGWEFSASPQRTMVTSLTAPLLGRTSRDRVHAARRLPSILTAPCQ
jgi:hypothetical protein